MVWMHFYILLIFVLILSEEAFKRRDLVKGLVEGAPL